MAGKAQAQYQQGVMAVNSVDKQNGGDSDTVGISEGALGESLDGANKMNSKQIRSQDSLPKKKSSTFQITSVKKLPGEQGVEDIDSLDDLDETHTEDVSSNMLELSQSTDIEPDPPSAADAAQGASSVVTEQSEDTGGVVTSGIGGTKQEINHLDSNIPGVASNNPSMTSSAGNNGNISSILSKEKVQDSQSRFKVVKIESKEPFRRGRWTCHDSLDPHSEKSAQNEKADSSPKGEEIGSGNSSAASSVHYIPGVDDPSKNPFGQGVSLVNDAGHTIVEPVPIKATAQTMQNGSTLAQGQENISGQSGVQQSATGTNTQSLANGQQTKSSITAQTQASTSQGQGVTNPGNVPMQQVPVPADRNGDFIQSADPFNIPPNSKEYSHPSTTEYDYRTSAPNVDISAKQPPSSDYSQTQQATEYPQAPLSLSSQPNLPQGSGTTSQATLMANSSTSPNKDNVQPVEPVVKHEGAFSVPISSDQSGGQAQQDAVASIDTKAPKSYAASFLRPLSADSFPPPLLEMVSAHMQPNFRGIPRPSDDG